MRAAYEAVVNWLEDLGLFVLWLAKIIGGLIALFLIAWGLMLALGAVTWILRAVGFQ